MLVHAAAAFARERFPYPTLEVAAFIAPNIALPFCATCGGSPTIAPTFHQADDLIPKRHAANGT